MSCFRVYLISTRGKNRWIEVTTPMPFIELMEEAPRKALFWGPDDLLEPEESFLRRRFERIPNTDCYLECE